MASIVTGKADPLGESPAFGIADEQHFDFAGTIADPFVDKDGRTLNTRGVVRGKPAGPDGAEAGELGFAGVLDDSGGRHATATPTRAGTAGRTGRGAWPSRLGLGLASQAHREV